MSKFSSVIKISVLALVLSLGLSYATAAWNPPTLPPPGANTDAPINIGATPQTKVGGDICTTVSGTTKCLQSGALPSATDGQTLRFNAGSWLSNSNLFNSGTSVGVGTTLTPQTLTVAGDIGATGDICTALGGGSGTCLSTVSGSSGVTGLTAGAGITLSPAGPNATGDVTVSSLQGYAGEVMQGTSGYMFPAYCRINISNGYSECKIATNWNMSSFAPAISSPFSATTAGSYSLSCRGAVAGGSFPSCCRMNNNTGTTECKTATNYALAGWTVVGSPF